MLGWLKILKGKQIDFILVYVCVYLCITLKFKLYVYFNNMYYSNFGSDLVWFDVINVKVFSLDIKLN